MPTSSGYFIGPNPSQCGSGPDAISTPSQTEKREESQKCRSATLVQWNTPITTSFDAAASSPLEKFLLVPMSKDAVIRLILGAMQHLTELDVRGVRDNVEGEVKIGGVVGEGLRSASKGCRRPWI